MTAGSLARQVQGQVLGPADGGFDEASSVWNVRASAWYAAVRKPRTEISDAHGLARSPVAASDGWQVRTLRHRLHFPR